MILEDFKKITEEQGPETIVCLYLKSGEKKIGKIIEINEKADSQYVKIKTEKGAVLRILDLDLISMVESLGTSSDVFETHSAKTPSKEPIDEVKQSVELVEAVNQKNIRNINIIIKEFVDNELDIKLELAEPYYSFPKKIENKLSEMGKAAEKTQLKKQWDQIMKRYEGCIKNKIFRPISGLADELRNLGSVYKFTGIFDYNSGYLMFIMGSDFYVESLIDFKNAYKKEKVTRHIYNIAALNLELKRYKESFKYLSIYISKKNPLKEIKPWYVFCYLINHTNRYDVLNHVFNIILNDKKNKDRINELLILFFKSLVYFLRFKNKFTEACDLLSLIDKGYEIENIKSLITTYINKLIDEDQEPETQIPVGDVNSQLKPAIIQKITAKSSKTTIFDESIKLRLGDKDVPPKSTVIKSITTKPFKKQRHRGYIIKYNDLNNSGIVEFKDQEFWFHKSAIIDNELFDLLSSEKNKNKKEKIEVLFEKGVSPKGPTAIQISLVKSKRKVFSSAINYYKAGNYSNAIAQIKKILQFDPNYPEARELYDKWTEYSRMGGVPQGTDPYSIAKRADLIEKDLKKAIKYYKLALKDRSTKKIESAIKDLASIYDRDGTPELAVELLRNYRAMIKNHQHYQNLLSAYLYNAGYYEEYIKTLDRSLKSTNSREQKAQIYNKLGNAYLRMEQYRKAEEVFRQAQNIDKQYISARRNLAISLSKQQKYEEAIEILSKIMEKSPDNKTAGLLETITNEKEGGQQEIAKEELEPETYDLSKFSEFFLNKCNYYGIPEIKKIEIKEGIKQNYNKKDIISLVSRAEEKENLHTKNRGDLYLTVAKVLHDTSGERDQLYKYLGRSFVSYGDVIASKFGEQAGIALEDINVAKIWYCEGLYNYDRISNYKITKHEKDAYKAIVRYLYLILDPSQLPTPLNSKFSSVSDVLEIFNRLSPKERNNAFYEISILFRYSRLAMSRIIYPLFNKGSLQGIALSYLSSLSISVPESLSEKQMNEFRLYWEKMRRMTFDDMRSLDSEVNLLTEQFKIEAEWIKYVIENRLQSIYELVFFDIEKDRIVKVQDILLTAIELRKNYGFFEQKHNLLKMNGLCEDLLTEIEEKPTKFSVENLIPLIYKIQKAIESEQKNLYETSDPVITLRLPNNSFVPDLNQVINVQVVIENKQMESRPAEDLKLLVEKNKEVYKAERYAISLGSLKGGQSVIINVPLKMTVKALAEQTFTLMLDAEYSYSTNEFENNEEIGEIKRTNAIFPIRLYSMEDFQEIKNPYSFGGAIKEPRMFFGRDKVINDIFDIFVNSPSQGKCLIVYGQKRSGKSSILYHLKRKFELEKKDEILILDLGNIGAQLDDSSKTPLFHQIIYSILNELKYTIMEKEENNFTPLGIEIPEISDFFNHPSPTGVFNDIFKEFLYKTSRIEDWKNAKVILMIDEFTYIYGQIIKGKISESFMKNWKALLESNYFNAILAGQDVMNNFKERFPNEFATSDQLRVTYLKEKNAIELIDLPIRIPPFSPDGEKRYREKAIESILKLTAGNPYYIQIICSKLVEYMNNNHIKLITDYDVEQVKKELLTGPNRFFHKQRFDNLIDSGDESKSDECKADTLAVLESIANNSKTGLCFKENINTENIKTPLDVILNDLKIRDVIEEPQNGYYKIHVELLKDWLVVKT